MPRTNRIAGARRSAPALFSYRPFWAKRFGIAPELPLTRDQMAHLGWDVCDIILVTGDAYVDHPSFGAALIGRLLEAQGFRVGIIAQPDTTRVSDFTRLGQPALFFGITAGNMDSMVNRYTADRRIRSSDAYTPDGVPHKRPDRAVIVYAQRCREAYREVPLVLGGIEASLRRVAHYDYWSDTVRRSILVDAKADLLVFGNGERQIVEIAHRLAAREPVATLTDIRGTACVRKPVDDADAPVVRLPSFEEVKRDPLRYAQASRLLHQEIRPRDARPLVQRHGDRDVWLNPPAVPLTSAEMDALYELPYRRLPHSDYGAAKIPAFEMIAHSVTIMRGCFGGCTFCAIAAHEGRVIQNRSEDSVLREIATIRDTSPSFSGVISDLGGPTANMYRMGCQRPELEAVCRRPSCIYPQTCPHLRTDHGPLIALYRQARACAGVKKVVIASGLRMDLAVAAPEYVTELVTHHVGGYLKIAPEHTEPGPLALMIKPGLAAFDRFRQQFDRISRAAGKEQYLIPYFIAAHPGTTDEDMLRLALWLKRNAFRPDQVQAFLPAPMALATAMYHSAKNPLHPVTADGETLVVPKSLTQRRLHKAFLRYHDPQHWPLLRAALRRMGRSDLIGRSKRHLVPCATRDERPATVRRRRAGPPVIGRRTP